MTASATGATDATATVDYVADLYIVGDYGSGWNFSDNSNHMTYSNGTTLTIMGKEFAISDITGMVVDKSEVTDNQVTVSYNGTTAKVTVAGNVAQYLTPVVSGAHVSIALAT